MSTKTFKRDKPHAKFGTTTPSHIETIREALKQCDMRINSQDRATHNRIDAALASLEALSHQPAQLVMSTDYEALYEHLKAGGEAISYVHYERSEGMPQSRNLCGAKRMPNGTTLLSGGSVQEIMSLHLNAFVSECQRLNLEWVAPRQPAQTEDLEAKAMEWLRTEQNIVENDGELRTDAIDLSKTLAAFARSLSEPK